MTLVIRNRSLCTNPMINDNNFLYQDRWLTAMGIHNILNYNTAMTLLKKKTLTSNLKRHSRQTGRTIPIKAGSLAQCPVRCNTQEKVSIWYKYKFKIKLHWKLKSQKPNKDGTTCTCLDHSTSYLLLIYLFHYQLLLPILHAWFSWE